MPLLRRLDHAQALDRPARHAGHVRPAIDVGHVEIAFAVLEIAPRRDDRRAGLRTQGQRIVTARLLGVQQQLVAEHVDQVDPHLFAELRVARPRQLAGPHGHPRAQEVLVAQRIRALVLGVDRDEAVAVETAAGPHALDRVRRPGADHRLAAVQAALAVDDGQRAPQAKVMHPEHAQHLLRAGNESRIVDRAGRGGVVAPIDRLVRAVGIDGPDAVGVAEVAVHVFPAGIQDAAVGRQRAVVVEQVVLADLVDVRSVRFHAEQVRPVIAAALVVLRLPRRGEHDPLVGQIEGIEVRHARRRGELPQSRAVAAISQM